MVRGWNRTTGTRRFKSLLYLLSYRTKLLVFPSCQPSMCHSAYASVVRQDFVVKTGLEPVVKDKRLVLLQGLGIMSIPTFNIPLRTPIPPPDYLRLRTPPRCLTSDTHSLSVLLLGHITIPFSREQHTIVDSVGVPISLQS